MANGGGYNQFGNYGQLPGQAQQGRSPFAQDGGDRQQRPGLPPLNTSTTGTSNLPTGQAQDQGWGPRQRPPGPPAPIPPVSSHQTPRPARGSNAILPSGISFTTMDGPRFSAMPTWHV